MHYNKPAVLLQQGGTTCSFTIGWDNLQFYYKVGQTAVLQQGGTKNLCKKKQFEAVTNQCSLSAFALKSFTNCSRKLFRPIAIYCWGGGGGGTLTFYPSLPHSFLHPLHQNIFLKIILFKVCPNIYFIFPPLSRIFWSFFLSKVILVFIAFFKQFNVIFCCVFVLM